MCDIYTYVIKEIVNLCYGLEGEEVSVNNQHTRTFRLAHFPVFVAHTVHSASERCFSLASGKITFRSVATLSDLPYSRLH